MRRTAAGLAMVFSFTAGTDAVAQQVFNLYFCGTSMTSSGPAPEDWILRQTDRGMTLRLAHELISYLNDIDTSSPSLGSPETHHKFIVDGVGTHGCGSSALTPTLGCRGWAPVLAEGQAALKEVVWSHPGQDVILNLVGFSRGGILTMMLARWVLNQENSADPDLRSIYERTQRINILAFDPVAGDMAFDDSYYCLNDAKIERYVGFYAEDERSTLFYPSVPSFHPSTKVWMARLPGAHETMVGNPQTAGRETLANDICEVCAIFPFICCVEKWDPFLLNVSWVTRVMAIELLESPQWGNVRFAANYQDAAHGFNLGWDKQYSTFADRISTVWNGNWDYSFMRDFSFTVLSESYRNELGFGWGCWPFDPIVGNLVGLQHFPRCLYRWYCGTGGFTDLLRQPDLPRLEAPDAWSALQELGYVEFRRGDFNADSTLDISDSLAILNHLFLGAGNVPCEQAGDANDDGVLDISDGVYGLSFLFVGGPPIAPPSGVCGVDPTRHDLSCDGFPGCS